MSSTPPCLVQYYEAVDAGDLDRAVTFFAPHARSAILLPGGAVRGNDRQAMRDYLNGRGSVVRRHSLLRTSVVGDLEFVYGAVIEGERTTTGHFLAAARVEDGLITGYQVAFDPELALIPDA